jgi:hypothetical protein
MHHRMNKFCSKNWLNGGRKDESPIHLAIRKTIRLGTNSGMNREEAPHVRCGEGGGGVGPGLRASFTLEKPVDGTCHAANLPTEAGFSHRCVRCSPSPT